VTELGVADRPTGRRTWIAAAFVAIGGLAMTALFVPFTLAHGPTSYNEGREILGRDMLGWGLLLGVLPNVLIVAGLWSRRDKITGGGRGARVALTLSCVALLADAAVTLAFRGLGAPFVLFLLAPATIALAVLIPKGDAARARARVVLAGLGAVLATGLALALIPLETSDAFNGYRIFGSVTYGLGGLLWACLGLSLAPASND
jgi:hypothetical protein